MGRCSLVAALVLAPIAATHACAPFGEAGSSGAGVDGGSGNGSEDAAGAGADAGGEDAGRADGGEPVEDAGPAPRGGCVIDRSACAIAGTVIVDTSFDHATLGDYSFGDTGDSNGELDDAVFNSAPSSFGVRLPATTSASTTVPGWNRGLTDVSFGTLCFEACVLVTQEKGNWNTSNGSFAELVNFTAKPPGGSFVSMDIGVDGNGEWYLQTQHAIGGMTDHTDGSSAFGRWTHLHVVVDANQEELELVVDGVAHKQAAVDSLVRVDGAMMSFDVGGTAGNGTPPLVVHYDDFFAVVTP